MVKLEATLLDKIISRGLLNRRQMGRATKFNVVSKADKRGVLEMMYMPRNTFEQYIGKAIHASLPFLSYFTYRFHVERVRASGMKLEDQYEHTFFREPYIHWHIYAQHFHPWTLNERIRATHFYRKPKILFKGFKVPDWAQSHKSEGWDMDVHYSRKAWEQAMQDFNSEFTPTPFVGERLDPNLINWFRFEQVGKGFSSRLFYNEKLNPTWHRHGGHLDNQDKVVHSFKYGDQKSENVLGFDVSTKEGKEALDAEVQRWKEMTPEIYEAFGFDQVGTQQNRYISQEPHFQRALTHYRTHTMQQRIEQAVENGQLSQDDVNSARAYFDERGLPSGNMLALGQKGLLDGDHSFEAFQRVLEATGLDGFSHSIKTSQPADEQFLEFFDRTYDITEKGLTEALPLIIADERDRERVQRQIEEGNGSDALPRESTQQLA
jgi:hypothetical protein